MNVKFYRCTEPPEQVSKSLDKDNPILTVTNVRFIESESLAVREPRLVFAPGGNLSEWVDIVESARFNYFYIPKFTRFYKITEMTTRDGLIFFRGVSDALTSFKDDILNSRQFITRQANKRSAYLPDSKLPIRAEHNYKIKTFGKNVDDKTCTSVILSTVGVGGTVVNSD